MEFNRKTMRALMGLVAFGVLLNAGVHHLGGISRWMTMAIGVLSPILMGLLLALVLNIPLTLIEEKLLKERRGRLWRALSRVKRPVSLTLSLAIVLGIVAGVVCIVVPQLTGAVSGAVKQVIDWLEATGARLIADGELPQEAAVWLESLELDGEGIRKSLADSLKNGVGSAVRYATSAATSVFGGATSALVAVILAINVLSCKEKLCRQLQSVVRAYVVPPHAQRVIDIGRMTNRMFSSFLAGQLTEALILAAMCYVGMLIFRLPYALLISVVVGVSALVPIFGALFATAVGALLILTVEPIKALGFVVFFIVLQQIEGNVIYPRVMGTRMGLPALWVLVAITVGGGVLGIAGMLLSVPVCAVLYALLKESVHGRLAARKRADEAENVEKSEGM